jgi:uncharacterized damage-inducible protein DinB
MTINELTTLYDYSYWANRKLHAPLSQLTAEEFAREIAGSWGSVRNTLVHMMSAEGGWLERAGGPRRGPALNPADFPTFDAVGSYWAAQEQKMRAFLAAMSDADLQQRLEFTIPQLSMHGVMTRGEMLHHAVIHNGHHRGQVALLVRALGHVPGNVDIMFYYMERFGAASAPGGSLNGATGIRS